MDTRKIGISTKVFKSPSNMADLIGTLAVNFDNIEIGIESDFYDIFNNKSALAKEINKINQVRDFVNPNLQITILAPHTDQIYDISDENETNRLNALNYVIQTLEFAQQVMASDVIINCKSFNDKLFNRNQLNLSLNYLNKMLQEKNINLLLNIKNEGNHFDPLILIDLCEKHKMVYLAIDMLYYNRFYFEGKKSAKADFKQIIPYIRNIYFNDEFFNKEVDKAIKSNTKNYKNSLELLVESGYQHNFIAKGQIN